MGFDDDKSASHEPACTCKSRNVDSGTSFGGHWIDCPRAKETS